MMVPVSEAESPFRSTRKSFLFYLTASAGRQQHCSRNLSLR